MREAIALGIGAGLGILGFVLALAPSRQALAASLRVLDDDPAISGRRRLVGGMGTEVGVSGRTGSNTSRSSFRRQLEGLAPIPFT
jgi:hypothetical protein